MTALAAPASANKTATQLRSERFAMLEDIAAEMTGDIIFPTCFDSAIQIGTVMRSPRASMGQVAAAVGADPLVASKLLRMANSAMYNSGGKQITNVEAAVIRLGMSTVRNTALACAMEQMLRARQLVAFESLSKALWDHSLKTAAYARVLAAKLTRVNPETAMFTGLVHDLGAFYMLDRAGRYTELTERPATVSYLIAQWHESIGNVLMEALELPEEIVEATRELDQPVPPVTALRSLKDVIFVANLFAGGLDEMARQDLGDLTERPELQQPEFVALQAEMDEAYHHLVHAF
ncbi:HD-like signal output (HDOD) domain, no enzymatic activity [Andreprevotia lacus DSM 23236]|jgi:HD-like signal output (HDOD) protein|uniref:HD-like signal output (HDOD) domain, no enzymatic activity n=1 Tax=Andreprevotia lacus DSM 23236 TaxID=1121001 RepID=A0A1W1XMV9_9NEIS|nr:HDOD domain-containing protein [Andreprevotia lacus]SMC25320.1 HD-like signal output (HDOD) domain, no enzymatic activity [Andreprevotia lacus DSM 23236]